VRCVVPNVIGRTLVIARAKLIRAHCRVGTVRRVFSTKRKRGRVLAERPLPGTRHRRGFPVNLKVGKGPRPRR
jgi:beta-lactam-binding protein with PASTA domain